MTPIIHGAGTFEHPNLRTFYPEDPETVTFILQIDIGPRKKGGSDSYTIRVATPQGLALLPVQEDGTIAYGKLLIIARYDYDTIWKWLEATVDRCEANSWEGCVENLRDKFHWEFEGYQEGRRF
jgi:Immunity protein 8